MTQPAGQLLTTKQKLDVIRRYYDACSTGDVDALVETVCDDVVHYFLAPNPGSAPVTGALDLAHYWRKVQARIEGRWIVDRILGEGDEAVIEWTLFWRPPEGPDRVATRGAEWYRFEGGRIAEVRAYYQQLQMSTELEAFDYAGRGYSRVGSEASRLHVSAGAGSDA
jgi:ketosteroid isomerase-like protein